MQFENGNPFAQPAQAPSNPQQDLLTQMFGSQQNFQSQIQQMQARIQTMGQTPQQLVQQMLSSGRCTPQQFEWASQIANQLTGRRF